MYNKIIFFCADKKQRNNKSTGKKIYPKKAK